MAIQASLEKKKVSPAKLVLTSSIVILLALVIALGVAFLQYRNTEQASRNASLALEAEGVLLTAGRDLSLLLTHGNLQIFDKLRNSEQQFSQYLKALLSGGQIKGVDVEPIQTPDIDANTVLLNEDWKDASDEFNAIFAKEEVLARLHRAYDDLLVDKADAPLFALASDIARLAIRDNESPKLVELAMQLDSLVLRLSRNAGAVLTTPKINPEMLTQLGQDTLAYRSIVTRLLRGDTDAGLTPLRSQAVRARLGEFLESAESFDAGLDVVLADVKELGEAEQLIARLDEQLGLVALDISNHSRLYASYGFDLMKLLGIGALFLVAVIALIYMARRLIKESLERAQLVEQENSRNQEAILQLLDETAQVAEGDMTVRATVSEAITGAIADALNFTLDEMSTVVRGINKAADHVAEETEKTQQISEQLFAASQQQSQEILKTADTVLQVTQSIGEVAQSATQSAQVAQESLDAAGKGGVAVRSQIESMGDIRTQIQETAKRIKRLGDSSLEIGEIVGLISDITEQTNVLALNAAIQAASAGEAGRGFAVVAEEVQRLAERSGEATKQIEAIVKTIQADTQDAVAAMERSTTGVVQGTRLSEEAGQALSDIERVSKTLSELIQGISEKTQAQAASVETVRGGIETMLKTTEDTTQGTEQTTVSINRLSQVAAELRSAVSGFKV